VSSLSDFRNDRFGRTRARVARILGNLGEQEPVKVLKDALVDDPHRFVRASAELTLGKRRERDLIESLVFALGDADRDVRVAAVETLQKLGVLAPIEPLVAALGDSDANVRRASVI